MNMQDKVHETLKLLRDEKFQIKLQKRRCEVQKKTES